MRNVFKLLVVCLVASGPAHAVTITDPEFSSCLDNNGATPGTGCDISDLLPGNTYVLQSERFKDARGNSYDVAVDVLLQTTPDPEKITAFGQFHTGGFVQYNVLFVNPVGDTPMTIEPMSLTPFVPEDTFFTAFFEDIDSNGPNSSGNGGGTFSEFVGVDMRDVASTELGLSGDTKLTTGVFGADLDSDVQRALTQVGVAGGGFSPDPSGLSSLELAEYSFAYAQKIAESNGELSWRQVDNIQNRVSETDSTRTAEGLKYEASFDIGSGPVDFNFIYGVANEGSSGTNTRQFGLNIVAELRVDSTAPVPEIDGPVLVQVGFALAGLYVLMLGRRRSEDDMEMRQAAA